MEHMKNICKYMRGYNYSIFNMKRTIEYSSVDDEMQKSKVISLITDNLFAGEFAPIPKHGHD